MKCIVLAGGIGERLWPLSRKSLSKQFIELQRNHSVFQETIARNIPYCDEFIIVTNYEFRTIILNQMEAFQGVPYRCIFEEEPRNTAAAITIACLGLQPSEYVFVVASDHLINTTDCHGVNYKDSILKAKKYARNGRIVLFGKKTNEINERFGYYTDNGFYEKPDRTVIKQIGSERVLQNLGIFLFQNGTFLNEFKKLQPKLWELCNCAHNKYCVLSSGVLYKSDTQSTLPSVSIEKTIVEKTDKLECIEVGYDWSDIGSLEDLTKTNYEFEGIAIQNDCSNSVVLNNSSNRAVVLNELDNVLVVNTDDAVYVGRRGKSHLLKRIIHDNEKLKLFAEQGNKIYRSWGYFESLVEENSYRVRRVVILPGKTIYEHTHKARKENWTVVEGNVLVSLDGKSLSCAEGDNVDIAIGISHQLSNIGEHHAIIIETASGSVLQNGDICSTHDRNLTESDLGMRHDPVIKLLPAFKDYLWGGTKLRDLYNKQCDYEVVAESWELSAHPAGNSIVASGKHKGLTLSQYLHTVGKSVLGWKSLQDFPLLIKFIDAKENLSVQIHPNDDYALEKENEYGKNEMWYVIDSEPGAGLYVGFNRNVSREEIEQRIKDNTILDVLNFYPSKPGDIFFIPAGTVHAIGAGNLIYEIQQSSNCTYRLYDYDRRDKFGNPRELHLEKALDVMNFEKFEPIGLVESDGGVKCKYFEVKILDVEGRLEIALSDDSFYVVTCLKGNGSIVLFDTKITVETGETVFIPAVKANTILNGEMTVFFTHI